MKKDKSASVETWLDQLNSGNLVHNTAKVLDYITVNSEFMRAVTIDDLRNDLKLLHPTATSCITALLDEGLIVCTGTIKKTYGEFKNDNYKTRTSTYSLYTSVNDLNERKRLKEARRLTKFTDWLSRGLEEFSEFLPEETKDKLALLLPF